MGGFLKNYEELENKKANDIVDVYQFENEEEILIWGEGFVRKVSDKTFDEVVAEIKNLGYATTFKK